MKNKKTRNILNKYNFDSKVLIETETLYRN